MISKLSPLLIALLVIGSIAFLAVPAVTASSPTQRLGFWLQDSNPFPQAQTFFNAMFLTPPYPSSMEVMIFGIQQDEISGLGCSTSAHYTGQSASYWGRVAQMADAYPNIRLIFDIYFDPSSGGSGTYGLSCFNALAKVLAQYPSVYGIGVEGEYTSVSAGMTEAEMQTAMNDVTATGKLFINYYSPVPIPSGGYDITHTNFPDVKGLSAYDQVGTLQDYDSHTVGLDSGFYANTPFPGTVICPIGANAITYTTAGWNQCVVSTELSTAASFSPASARQFLELDVGFSSSGSFTGVSGGTTNQLWDNPSLRGWIWADPTYQSNFILSTSAATTSTTSTTSSVSTSTASLSSTKTTTSTSTSTASTTTTSASDPTLSTYVKCPSGIQSCGGATPVGVGTYQGGTQVEVTAYPYGGYAFSYWNICTSSCVSYTGNPMQITMSANTQATAVFVRG